MALAMLDKYATDPDFREILRTYGAAVIPPIAQTDTGPETLAYLRAKPRLSFSESLARSVLFLSGENGQATIRTIKNDGLERVAELNSTESEVSTSSCRCTTCSTWATCLGRGHAPTSGELTWALVDGCFVVADALSLAAVQPEGVVAAEAARAEVKARGARGGEGRGPRAGRGRDRVGGPRPGPPGSGGRASRRRTERLSRWWTVRLAGGTYRVLRRLPEALPRLERRRARRPRPPALHPGRDSA